jgi:hypothetical protein
MISFFGFSIKGRTGFIQKHNGWIGVEGAGNGDALTFAAGELEAPLRTVDDAASNVK